MPVAATAAVGLALALEAVVGEPPEAVHPVAWFGRAVALADREWARPRAVGAVLALVLPALAVALVGGATVAAAAWRPGGVPPATRELPGVAVAALVLFATTSLRMLLTTARDVAARTERDLDGAREDLRALAGRDAAALSAGQVRSAAVESLAENLADGLVAPLGAFAVAAGAAGLVGVGTPVSLGLAAAAATWIKAVNTLDSMLGYVDKRVGWAPARLDDLAMWLPARAGAVLIALAAWPASVADAAGATGAAGGPAALNRAREWAREPSSPNSGWPMATLAAALGVRFEKPGAYALPGGEGLPAVADAERGVRIVGIAGLAAYPLAGLLALPSSGGPEAGIVAVTVCAPIAGVVP